VLNSSGRPRSLKPEVFRSMPGRLWPAASSGSERLDSLSSHVQRGRDLPLWPTVLASEQPRSIHRSVFTSGKRRVGHCFYGRGKTQPVRAAAPSGIFFKAGLNRALKKAGAS